MAAVTKIKPREIPAERYAADLMFQALLEIGDAARVSELARQIGRPDVDIHLVRVIAATSDRFMFAERKCTLQSRRLDPQHSFERNVFDTIQAYGLPIPFNRLCRELSIVYNRPMESLSPALKRILADAERSFWVTRELVGLTSWLLDASSGKREDILFDNFLESEIVTPLEKLNRTVLIEGGENAAEFLDSVGQPVSTRSLQYIIWKSSPQQYDPIATFQKLWANSQITLVSEVGWCGPKTREALAGEFSVIAQKSIPEDAELGRQPELSQPLVINDEEMEKVMKAVLDSDTVSRATNILEEVFEVTPIDLTYEADLYTLTSALRSRLDIVWLGADRFLPVGAIPAYVESIPETLRIPRLEFVDSEGNPLDRLIEDEGFDGTLRSDIATIYSQDVQDEEELPSKPDSPPATVRCVLKYHHKEIGTLPLSLLPYGYFPLEPNILQVRIQVQGGIGMDVWVNNTTRLAYGLLDWYYSIPVDSGAVFYLDRLDPDHYEIKYMDETEPTMFISRNRLEELIELHRRAQEEELSMFDIIREIMEHYRRGMEFLTLHTEANVVRRVSRRMIASLLSSYHCFFQRSGVWVYDLKKLSQGFDRSKRKYLKK
ncbi:MAG: hypothetical protein M1330_03470 [Armatimonadetes bacterium]|nr:hypothetical protein [Armatimonadota bacterium]